MNRTAIGSVTGAVLIGALLLRIPTPSTRSASEGRRTQQSATLTQSIQPKAGKELPEDGPWKASQDYFGPARSDREDCLPAETSGNRQNVVATQRGGRIRINNLRDQLWCIPHDVTVQAMIATIPDPVHTRLPLVFDRSIEAIQLAAQAMNYAPDRYWLPWNPQGEPEWNNYDSRQKAEQDIEEKEKQPGVLMFRWDGKNHEALAQVLYVFLVAETPTTGINGQQFRNAVDYVQVLCSNVGAAGCASGSHTCSGMTPAVGPHSNFRPDIFRLSFFIHTPEFDGTESGWGTAAIHCLQRHGFQQPCHRKARLTVHLQSQAAVPPGLPHVCS